MVGNHRSVGNRKKIVFVIGSLEIGGAERQMAFLASLLQRRGWAATVFALDDRGPLREQLLAAGCEVVGGGTGRGGSKLGKLVALARAQFLLIRLLLVRRASVVHGFLPLTNFVAALAGKLTMRPLVVTSRRALGTHQDRRPALRWMDGVANALSNVITANSEAVADDVARRDGYERSRIAVIGNGLDLSAYTQADSNRDATRRSLGLSDRAIALVKVANLIPYKGHAELIEAFAKVAIEDDRLQLFLIGEDRGLQPMLTSLSSQAGLSDRVHFLGRRQDVPALLAGMDIGVLASHEEGLSNALLEKLAAGLPAVATNVGGNPEALEGMPNCLIVPAKDVKAIEQGIRDIVNLLPEDAAAVNARRRIVLERYSLEGMVDAYERLYLDYLNRR